MTGRALTPPHDAIAALIASLPHLLTRRQVAELLSLTERTVDRMRHRGELESIELSDAVVRITRASLDAYLRRGAREAA